MSEGIEKPWPGSEFTIMNAEGELLPGQAVSVHGATIDDEGVEVWTATFTPPGVRGEEAEHDG